ncbi:MULTISPECIES: glycosyltransferase [Rhizobium]|uniref:Glycosyltransferase n=1 Tax=Rhizobium rhododendri TaxID=2506430 RepID=A0ABY8IUM6_9HYPH|nr:MULTISPECIES: glycosyltransferase [Rhizobium]MBZ5759414.1 glycosyltransferase [Rhizobium sp. VS19-DR96]MBZ5765853.1 glycosyltransferase [Rhizobium sp. VS19-DR129.2]MBZ5773937.1 glycosyltransferase [Rhizobium sp. VS19-DRK62.2]MBZ5785009.1 glycosyltransferase [Rhizobium sp. VS19-DR121]MBZ5801914.1 glycosyltransferase [Rhizobium sp. VS19-DR181]
MNVSVSAARLVEDDLSAISAQISLDHIGPELSIVIPTLNERESVAILVDRLRATLAGIDWEVIFVDDDSSDDTIGQVRALSVNDRRIRGLRRVGRRGLAGACIEGILSSSAPVVAVMDADLQHDETRLAEMFNVLRTGNADLVVASRYIQADGASDGLSRIRHAGSRLAVGMAQSLLGVRLSDPMSGFFMIRREFVEAVAPRLSNQGFKILLDIVASSPKQMRIEEVSYAFSPRLHGVSKLDASVVFEYLGLLISKASGDFISARFLAFCLVGSTGLVVNLAFLRILLGAGLDFPTAQTAAMLITMVVNYTLNNALTYRDRRRHGWRFVTGLGMFAALCSFGVFAGVGVSTAFYNSEPRWWLAGLAGAAIGAAWNYFTNSAITWRKR